MLRRRQWFNNAMALLCAAVAATAITLLVTSDSECPTVKPADAPAQIEEDGPRWDCHTMGNMVCGSDDISLGA